MFLCLLGQCLIVMVIMIEMKKEPSESKLKIISKLNRVQLRNYFLYSTTYAHFHLIYLLGWSSSDTGKEQIQFTSLCLACFGIWTKLFSELLSFTFTFSLEKPCFLENTIFSTFSGSGLVYCLLAFLQGLYCSWIQAAWCSENVYLWCVRYGCLAVIQEAFMSCPKGKSVVAALFLWHMRYHLRKLIHKMYFLNGAIYH